MLKQTLAALILTSSLVACHNSPQVLAIPQPEHVQPGQMTVTGSATLEVSPDCADLTMTFTVDNGKPGIATAGVDAKEAALVAALHKIGVEPTDIKLSQLNLEPVYEPNPEGWAQITIHAYRAQITVTATTHDFGKVSAMMEAGADAGATSLSSQFRRSDLPELKKKVRDMALAAAKEKASQTAGSLGIKLGRVVSVAENPGGYMWSNAYFPRANTQQTSNGGTALGGTLQPLTLEVSIGYELAREI